MELGKILLLASVTSGLLIGCNATDSEKERIDTIAEGLEDTVLKPYITYPAEGHVIDKPITIQLDLAESVTYEKVRLLVNGKEYNTDTEAPFEFDWEPYYWSTESSVVLQVKAFTSGANAREIRSEPRNVRISPEAFTGALSLSTELTPSIAFGTTEVPLEWTALAYAKGYEIKVNDKEPLEVSSNSTSIPVKQEGLYTVAIRATDVSDNTGKWNTLGSFEVAPPTTPVASFIDHDSGESKTIKVTLDESEQYDSVSLIVNGKEIATKTKPPYEFDWTPYYWTSANQITWSISAKRSNGQHIANQPYTLSDEELNAIAQPIVITTGNEITQFTDVNQVAVAWNKIEHAASYQYTINGKEYSTDKQSAQISAEEIGKYIVQVRAIDSEGRSGAWSAPVDIEILAPEAPQITSPPNGQSELNISEMAISWIAVDGATTYELKLDEQVLSTSGTSLTVDTPDAGTTYNYRIRAVDSFGRPGNWSEHYSFSVENPPALKTNVEVIENEEDFTLRFTWDIPEGTENFNAVFVLSSSESFDFMAEDVRSEIPVADQEIEFNVPVGRYYYTAYIVDDYQRLGYWTDIKDVNAGLFRVDANIASNRYFGDDRPVDFLIDDSNIVVLSAAGQNYDGSGDDFDLSKWNQDGNKVWQKSYNFAATAPRALDKNTEGGYIVAGSGLDNKDSIVISTDELGDYQWSYLAEGHNYNSDNIFLRQYVNDVVSLSDSRVAFLQRSNRHVKTGDYLTSLDTEMAIVIYDRTNKTTTKALIEQPTSGEYLTPSNLFFDGNNIYAIGGYKAEEETFDSSSDDYIPSENESGAYLTQFNLESETITSTKTASGLGNGWISNAALSESKIVVGYFHYNGGGATLFSVDGKETAAIFSSSINSSLAELTNNGDILLVGINSNSTISGRNGDLTIIKYRNGEEFDSIILTDNLNSFTLSAIKYHPKYGLVILGTSKNTYNNSDSQTVVFNVSDDFEYLRLY